jgi:hypothetical protein
MLLIGDFTGNLKELLFCSPFGFLFLSVILLCYF